MASAEDSLGPSAASSSVPALSKRKFLDSIAALDAAVRDPLATTAASLTKRRRTSAPHRTSTPALEAILARTPRASTPSKAPPPPSYLPTSLPALLDRLATYRLTTFSPSKPPSLSALSCALHGWVHTPSTRERVHCVTCGQGVVVLPPSAGDGAWSSPVGQRLRQEHERLVSSEGKGHAETCPWRLRPCARSLYRLPSGGLGVQSGGRRRLLEEIASDAIEMDAAGLSTIEVALPPAATRALDVADGRERLARAVATVREPAAEDHEGTAVPSTTALLLATFGWKLLGSSSPLVAAAPSLARSASSSSLSSLHDPGSPILACTYCTRRILASAYSPSISSPPRAFDLVQQHQAFCPHVDPHVGQPPPAATETDLRLKPGWQIRLEAVLQSALAAPTEEGDAGRQQTGAQDVEEKKHPSDTREILSYVRKLLGPKGTLKERVVLRGNGSPAKPV
ncbi:hypothetical protein BMF94_1408 [Rhodotorula taiwanensis]|uniref:C3HC-type domain-containing protein n=1 Tax=Rhodotorula taiwanensis TaxID=741276 RepID=A0A2S5BFF4_9BASI|nr:hypothetical protein BMF94_1408 [Rhodotorula taiwanensis]